MSVQQRWTCCFFGELGKVDRVKINVFICLNRVSVNISYFILMIRILYYKYICLLMVL